MQTLICFACSTVLTYLYVPTYWHNAIGEVREAFQFNIESRTRCTLLMRYLLEICNLK